MAPTHIRLLKGGHAVKDIPLDGRNLSFCVDMPNTEVYEIKRLPRAKFSPLRVFSSTYTRREMICCMHWFAADGAEYI